MGIEFAGCKYPHKFLISQSVLIWGLLGNFQIIELIPIQQFGKVYYKVAGISGPHDCWIFKVIESKIVDDGKLINFFLFLSVSYF